MTLSFAMERFQAASLNQPLRQVAIGAHLIGVHSFSVGHEHPIIIKHFALDQIAFSYRANLDDVSAKGLRYVIA